MNEFFILNMQIKRKKQSSKVKQQQEKRATKKS